MIDINERMIIKALEKAINIINNSFSEKGPYSCSNILYKNGKIEENLLIDINNSLYYDSCHDFTEVCMCLEGTMALEIKGEIVKLNEGHYYIILPGLTHCEIPIKNRDYTALWLGTYMSKARLHLSGIRNGDFYISDLLFLTQSHIYSMILDNMLKESSYEGPLYHILVKTYLLQMYIKLFKQISERKSIDKGYESWRDSIVFQIRSLIMKNGAGNIKVRDISREMCMSKNYINNIFKAKTGMTITQYMENQRIVRAKQLLANSDMSINEISRQLGYYDRYHFTKAFKKATGYTPGSYRKQNAERTKEFSRVEG
ncbi:MAG TPA: AraC family transcriptional regulator [Clostridiaceae bacterium]|nr:AraC family transcriptional regulator [Clostridiaceae bacterium]